MSRRALPPHPVLMSSLVPDAKIPGTSVVFGVEQMLDSSDITQQPYFLL